MNLTKDMVCDAAARIERGKCMGLCNALEDYDSKWVPELLRAMGGDEHSQGDWFWPIDDEGREERLMMLAFLYEWSADGILMGFISAQGHD